MTIHLRAASPQPTTLNTGNRTVEAIVSTGADAPRPGYIERLDLRGANLSRLIGAAVLDAHRSGSTRDQLGVVEAAELRREGIWVRMRFRSNDAAQAVLADIGDGTLRGLSIGYTVAKWQETRDGDRRIRTAIEWTPIEVSIVPVPADPGAHFRHEENQMTTTEQTAERPAETARQTRAQANAEIRTIAESAGLTRAWADAQIDAEAPVEAARAAAFEEMRTRQAANQTRTTRAAIGFDHVDPAVIAGRMAEALAADAAGVPVTDPGATQYRGLGFRGIARQMVAGGERMAAPAAIDAAFSRAGAVHSTSDFAAAVLGAGSRIVLHSYGEAASQIEANLVSYGTAPDFRTVTEVGLGGFPNLQPLNEGGEIKSVTIAEASTTWKIGTYASRFDVSRNLLVNDDLGLFGNTGAALGRAARRTETAAIVALLVSNPTLADGVALFHANHGNLAGTGAALSDTTLPTALQAMQAQKGLNGEVIGIRPAYLVVSPAMEFTARKLLATIAPTKSADVNPLSGIVELLVEPRLSGNAWYVFGKPSDAPVLKVGHLAGQTGPVVQTQDMWNGLGTSFRVWIDFGVTAVDHRGAYLNAGA